MPCKGCSSRQECSIEIEFAVVARIFTETSLVQRVAEAVFYSLMFVLIWAICSTHGSNVCFILSKYACNSSNTFSILAMRREKRSIPELSLLIKRRSSARTNGGKKSKNSFLKFKKGILKNRREESGQGQDPKPCANQYWFGLPSSEPRRLCESTEPIKTRESASNIFRPKIVCCVGCWFCQRQTFK